MTDYICTPKSIICQYRTISPLQYNDLMLENPKHIHIIGICGVATSAIAIAFHKKGWKVTGSDKGFFPPVSTELEKNGISFYAGWHPEKMIEGSKPDIIMIGTASGSHNPERIYAKENNISIDRIIKND